jgi:hypothetical protein
MVVAEYSPSAMDKPLARAALSDLAGRDEPALRDSSKHCALLGHNLVTV